MHLNRLSCFSIPLWCFSFPLSAFLFRCGASNLPWVAFQLFCVDSQFQSNNFEFHWNASPLIEVLSTSLLVLLSKVEGILISIGVLICSMVIILSSSEILLISNEVLLSPLGNFRFGYCGSHFRWGAFQLRFSASKFHRGAFHSIWGVSVLCWWFSVPIR